MSEYKDASVRDDLVSWAHPLIVDEINDCYFRRLRADPAIARELAIQHYRVWRQVLSDNLDGAAQLRTQLIDYAQANSVAAAVLDAVDRAVLDELMDVVIRRFQRTPYLARSYGMSLLDAATGLARTRSMAA